MKLFSARRAPRAYMAPTSNVVMPASSVVASAEADPARGARLGVGPGARRVPGSRAASGAVSVPDDRLPTEAAADPVDPATRGRRRDNVVLSVEAHRVVVALARGGEPIACLARRFPHVVNEIADVWRDPSAVVLRVDEFLIDRRGGRRGFPADALAELLALRRTALKRSVQAARAAPGVRGERPRAGPGADAAGEG